MWLCLSIGLRWVQSLSGFETQMKFRHPPPLLPNKYELCSLERKQCCWRYKQSEDGIYWIYCCQNIQHWCKIHHLLSSIDKHANVFTPLILFAFCHVTTKNCSAFYQNFKWYVRRFVAAPGCLRYFWLYTQRLKRLSTLPGKKAQPRLDRAHWSFWH